MNIKNKKEEDEDNGTEVAGEVRNEGTEERVRGEGKERKQGD